MSDTRSTLTDRSSSILSKDHPPDKRSKSDKLPGTPTHDFDPTDVLVQKSGFVVADGRPESCGLVQRCVIIQKDENGFGLTVSGDNPVFVQLVKQDGAAMRAGVQTGDRIIKVNGTLVTHSNHVEVVKLIKSGSYVALTVLGRPPGLPQVPLPELDLCREETFVTTPDSYSATERTSSLVSWEESSVPHNQRLDNKRIVSREQQDMQGLKDEHNKTSKPLWDVQEAKMHIPHPLNRATHEGLYLRNTEDGCWTDEDKGDLSPVQRRFYPASPVSQRDSNCSSPKSTPRDSLNSCPSPDVDDRCDLDSRLQTSVRSPPSRQTSEIIVLEDEDFDTEQEQVNGQCSCFQDIELLKTRPAHLAVFLHHVISQFDPAPLLCYLYADLYKHTNSKEARRIFTDFLGFFIDRGAHLKVAVPESISYELERRRLELIPEELHRQYIQTMQETLLPDVQRHLEDFRQKRNMGLTLAEVELARLDSEHLLVERERACAENILSKIDDVLVTSQPTEEEKCTTMQYVIYTYMKHLGLRVKEHRILESKRPRIHFLPSKLRKSKTEKEGEEKLKKPRFPIRVPPRWPVRIESIAGGKAGESFKQRPQKQMSQPAMGGSEPIEGGRLRGSQSSEGSDLLQSPGIITSPPFSSPYSSPSDPSGRETEFSMSPSAVVPRLSDGLQAGDVLDSIYPPCDYIPYSVDPLDEDREGDRLLDVGTPKLIRRFEELQSEDDQGSDVYSDVDPPNWQQLVGRDVLAGLTPHEIKRQEVINELFYTERAHVRMLKVLDRVFYQKLNRDNILPPADIKNIFTNLEDIIQLHMRIADHMTAIRKKYESSVIDHIGDELLSWFSGGEEEMIKHAVCTFCSNQPFALELIKSRQKKDQRFTTFMQEAESNRLCRRLQLKDIIPAEMQRFTKYPLLMDNIAKYTDEEEEKDKVRRAAECCRKILNHVNQSVKESENKQRLEDYQRRLDLSSLKQSENPMISEFKNLDLTKRKMVHEGPLSWKINKDKTIELYTLLLEDILVLLQKQDERLILRCQSKNLAGTADTKHIFSPIIKLSTVLVRSVATDNRSFFVISMSENGAQIYELMAQTVSDQRMWQRQISQRADVMKAAKIHSVILLPQSDGDRDSVELSKFSKGSDRISTGSVQSAEKDFSPSAALRDCVPDTSEEDRVQRAGRDGSYLVSELMNDKDTDSIASSSKADEALKTLAALKQVLVTQLMAQDEGEHLGRSAGSRLLRTTSLRTPVEHSSIRTPSRAQDYTSGDTGFYECPEDYAAYLVLEGYGGSGESSTDDDIQVGRKELGLAHSCAADSGISLKFSSPSSGSTSRLSRQVLSHLRSLQANLNHLKEMETKYYNLLRQRPVGSTTDTDESRDKK
ncbi:rho guanine nucleotide exchange factor 12 isoform X1 [Triplophysa rosa]|uniref:rho guanine nucleotide exchange factor 12 isoform X1 n=1 Tax=Triplophysa rosa TaxID=992332 RepID=UPI00254621F5|nr:rho guanine nucleotide exchange factor 12 isoform X1 [Triplophysa rosa]XP_057206765.1 rho guanine nucleotide exchange factor 12 isoform X1 [Triplophysa rosa]